MESSSSSTLPPHSRSTSNPSLQNTSKNLHHKISSTTMAKTRKPTTKQPKNLTKQLLQSSNPPKTPKKYPEKSPPPSWAVVRSIFTCKHLQVATTQQDQQAKEIQILKPRRKDDKKQQLVQENSSTSKKNKKVKCAGSLCNNTKVMQKPELLGSSSRSIMKSPVKESTDGVVSLSSHSYSSLSSSSSLLTRSSNSSSTNNAGGGSSGGGGSGLRGMPFRRFSGCYECRMVVDPVLGMTRDSSLRSNICYCPDCGEIFMSKNNLEAHQAVRHAVSELGAEDTSKNIVEIIFQSSWLKKQAPICKIDRILKIHNTPKTLSNFESYRDAIKSKASKHLKKHPRCIADGNELLRFHSTTLSCSLGLGGSSNLCNAIPSCHICSIIKNGFNCKSVAGKGILTTATSGKAHDIAETSATSEHGGEKRAMLVCRVIAGRVKKNTAEGSMDEYDSVGGAVGVYSNLDELFVFNPKAILPCFVVIYTGF